MAGQDAYQGVQDLVELGALSLTRPWAGSWDKLLVEKWHAMEM